jgi:hypothetical protein
LESAFAILSSTSIAIISGEHSLVRSDSGRDDGSQTRRASEGSFVKRAAMGCGKERSTHGRETAHLGKCGMKRGRTATHFSIRRRRDFLFFAVDDETSPKVLMSSASADHSCELTTDE